MWEENFHSHHDSKPHGPTSVALDVTFAGAEEVYGLPEHGDTFALKETTSTDPYRLYNLDVFEFEVWNPMALYGSIPFVVAVGDRQTVGFLWLNAAETWVDVKKGPESAVMSSIVNLMSGSTKKPPQIETHWISESGIVDMYFFLGPNPKDVMRQYTFWSGRTPLPPVSNPVFT
jgi:alpha 1,3-glucosidase